MIELRGDVKLKDTIVIAMPKLVGEGFYMCTIRVEYDWKPSGVQVGPKVRLKPVKQVYKPDFNKNNASTSGKNKQVGLSMVSNSNPFDALNSVENDDDLGTYGGNSQLTGKGSLTVAPVSSNTTPIVEKINKLERKILDGKLMFVDDDGKMLYKDDSMVSVDSDSEVEERETKVNDDYDPYDDNLYGYDMSDNLHVVCDDLDIKVEILNFLENLDIQAVFEWLYEVDNIFGIISKE
ncbi:hypothetical protein Tco_0920741 [Tanacetum coccineum]